MLAGALTVRFARAVGRGVGAAWAGSVSAQALARLLTFLARLSRGSLFLSLDSARSRPLALGAGSLTERLLALFYRFLQRVLGGGFLGRAARALLAAVPLSALGQGRWLRPAGAGLLGLSVGRLVELVSGGASSPAVFAAAILLWGALLVGGLLLLARGERLLAVGSPVLRGVAFAWRSFAGENLPDERVALSPAGALPLRTAAPRWLAPTVSVLLGLTGLLAGLAEGDRATLAVVAAGLAALGAGLVLYRAEALLVVLALFPWLDWVARRSLGGLGAAWDELLLLGSLALLGFVVLVLRRAELRTVPLALPLLVAAAAALGSLAVRNVPSEVGLYALRITFQPLLFFFLGYLLPRDRRWVRLAVAAFLAASLLLALHGLFQYYTQAPMPKKWLDAHETTIGTRAYSIIENPNGLGAFLLLGSLLSVSLALSRLPRAQRVVMGLVSLVLLAGIGVTFSRGAWLSFLVGGLALAALAYRRLFAGLVAAGLLAPFLLPPAFLNRLTFALSEQYIAKSLAAGRLLMWSVALRRIANDPWFGVGLGTFGGTSATLYGYHKLWVDNFYVQLGAEGGVILLVAFLWLLLRAGKGLVAATLDHTDPYLRAVSAGAFAGFVAVLFANVTAGVWETLAVGAGFWFLTGMASAPASAYATPGSEAPAPMEGDNRLPRSERAQEQR